MPTKPPDLLTHLRSPDGTETPEQLFQRSIREREALPLVERIFEDAQLNKPEPKYEGAEMRAYDPDAIEEAYYKSVRTNRAMPTREGLATWRRLTNAKQQFDLQVLELGGALPIRAIGLVAALSGAKLAKARPSPGPKASSQSREACATCSVPAAIQGPGVKGAKPGYHFPQPADDGILPPRSPSTTNPPATSKGPLRERREDAWKASQGPRSLHPTYRDELSRRRSIESAEKAARAQGWEPKSNEVEYINLLREGSPVVYSAAPVKGVPPGWTNVTVHGSSTGFASEPLPFGGTGRWQDRSIDEIASLLKEGNGPIFLSSCETGKLVPGMQPMAQQLADHPLLKGRPVVAPTRTTSGTKIHHEEDAGRWFTFQRGKQWNTGRDPYADFDFDALFRDISKTP